MWQWYVRLAVLGTINAAEGTPVQKFPVGAACQAQSWCDYGKWIWCGDEGICECLHTKRQFFDAARNRCVAQAGTECNVYLGDKDCAKDATCFWNDGRGRCRCLKGYRVTGDGACVEGQLDADDAANEVEQGSAAKPSLPIYQYHQQRLGDVNYRYTIKSTTFAPKVNWHRSTSATLASSQSTIIDQVRETTIGRYSNEETWRRFWTTLFALTNFNSKP